MSFLKGMGNAADVRFKTLSCKDTVIVDSKCNLKIKNAKIGNLVVNKDETIRGNLVVDGCIKGNVCIDGNLMVTGNISGGGAGAGGGYSFITPSDFSNDGADPATINWDTSADLFRGHLFAGPLGTYDVTILIKDSNYTNFSFNVSEISFQQLQNNTGSPNLLGSPSLLFTNTNNSQSGFTATFNPTFTPSYWYYWGTNVGSNHLQTSARQV